MKHIKHNTSLCGLSVCARTTIAILCLTLLCGCWRMQEIGGWSADGGDTGNGDSDSDSITDPDTGFDGQWEWIEMESPTTVDLAAVWGTAWQNIYAVGEDGVILHFDGTGWSHVVYDSPTKPNLHAIVGTSASQIWATGANLFMLEFDGSQWEQQDTVFWPPEGTDDYHGICAESTEDAYVVGKGAKIAVFNGWEWSFGSDYDMEADFHTVACTAGTDVFIAGHNHAAFASSVLIRYTPLYDSVVMPHEPSDNMYGITGDQDGNFWAVGFDDGVGSKLYRLIEGGWTVETTSPHELLGMWADKVVGVWAVGNTADDDTIGVIQAWTGDGEPQYELEYDGTARLRGVWGVDNGGDRHVVAVGKGGTILHLFWSPV